MCGERVQHPLLMLRPQNTPPEPPQTSDQHKRDVRSFYAASHPQPIQFGKGRHPLYKSLSLIIV